MSTNKRLPIPNEIRNSLDKSKVTPIQFGGSPLYNPIKPWAALNKLPSYTWSLDAPAIGGRLGPYLQVDKIAILISGVATGGGTVTFNIEKRSVPTTPGTDLLAADITVDDAGEMTTTFADDDLPAGDWLYLAISDVSGIVLELTVTIITTGGLVGGVISPGTQDGHIIINESGVAMPTEPKLHFAGDVGVTDVPGSLETLVAVAATNHLFVDQSGGTGDTYGILVGALNGSNTHFFTSLGAYVTRTLTVYRNGQLYTQGSNEDWVEIDPATGAFDLNVAPLSTDQLTAVYGFLGVVNGPPGPPGPGYAATSVTSLLIEVASKNFATQTGLAYTIYTRARATSAANSANWMEGQVTSYSGTALIINVDIIGGSGTFDDWVFSLAGSIGLQGNPGTPAVNSVHHQQIIWTVDGTYLSSVEVGVSPLKFYLAYVGAGAIIEEIRAILGTAPSVANLRLRILQNGLTIFTGTDYVEIATGQTLVSRTTDFAGGGAAAMDDYFQMELVQGDADAANLVLEMRYKWTLTGS